MLIPEKDVFMNEINTIPNIETRDKLEMLYDHLKGYKNIDTPNNLVKEVINKLFISPFNDKALIPMEFIESPIGVVLFSILFGMKEKTYTIQDLVEFTKTPEKPNGFTKQYIGLEIQAGNLKATKINNRWTFQESDVTEWLIKKELK